MSSPPVAQSIRFHLRAKGFVASARSRKLHYRGGITTGSKIIDTEFHYQKRFADFAQKFLRLLRLRIFHFHRFLVFKSRVIYEKIIEITIWKFLRTQVHKKPFQSKPWRKFR